MTQLVLASSSVYRKQLLQRLMTNFICHAPDIDEQTNSELCLKDNVIALSKLKAQTVSVLYPQSIVIASDQLCSIDQKILGKPHTFANAFKQLRNASGKAVIFYTGLVVFDPKTQRYFQHCDETTVVFRKLSDKDITEYLEYEKPYDCAGSFKVESRGVCLFEKIINQDPTALIGLPLIKLCEFLRDIEKANL